MVTVRQGRPSDHQKLALLFEEMQLHYGVPCPPRESILAELASLPPSVEFLLAEAGDRPVGMATFSAIFPGPGLKGGFFLKELFVTQSARGTGVGKSMLREIARLALARGLTRVDWTADRNNARLLNWYDGTGAAREEDKVFFRLKGEALAEFAGET